MSFINDITRAFGIGTTTGGAQRPDLPATTGAPGQPTAGHEVTNRFGAVFQRTYTANIATVFERGVAGEFDDPTIALEEQAALQRLRLAREAAGLPPLPTTGVPGAPAVSGADAAPTGDAAIMAELRYESGADAAPPVGGGGANASGPPAAGDSGSPPVEGTAPPPNAAASHGVDPARVGIAEQREIYGVRVRQSEARLSNISRSLAEDFPKAASLPSAASGTWDPETYQPRSKAQAEAFAQRMVIDATEAAARLEIVVTQHDAATFEAQVAGSPEAKARVAQLDRELLLQRAYTDKLARIVDEASGGQVRDAGRRALSGTTARGVDDIPIAELAAALGAGSGSVDTATIERVIGASELAVEQETTPGGSATLQAITETVTAHYIAKVQALTKSIAESRERDHERWNGEDAKRAEKRSEAKSAERRDVRESQAEEQAAKRRAAQESQHAQWLETLSAARDEKRRRAG